MWRKSMIAAVAATGALIGIGRAAAVAKEAPKNVDAREANAAPSTEDNDDVECENGVDPSGKPCADDDDDKGDGDGECENGVDRSGAPCADADHEDKGDGDGEHDD